MLRSNHFAPTLPSVFITTVRYALLPQALWVTTAHD